MLVVTPQEEKQYICSMQASVLRTDFNLKESLGLVFHQDTINEDTYFKVPGLGLVPVCKRCLKNSLSLIIKINFGTERKHRRRDSFK